MFTVKLYDKYAKEACKVTKVDLLVNDNNQVYCVVNKKQFLDYYDWKSKRVSRMRIFLQIIKKKVNEVL